MPAEAAMVRLRRYECWVWAMNDAAKLDRHWHWKDLSAKIATDPLILLSIGIGDVPYSMAVRLAL